MKGFKDTFGKKSHSVCQIWLAPLFWSSQSVVFAFVGDLALDYLLFKKEMFENQTQLLFVDQKVRNV